MGQLSTQLPTAYDDGVVGLTDLTSPGPLVQWQLEVSDLEILAVTVVYV